MRKILTMAAMFAAMAGLFAGCSKDDEGSKRPDMPTIELAGASIDQPQEMVQDMTVRVDVTAPGKIEELTISIDSPFLTDEMLAMVGLSRSFSLANPASADVAEGLASLGLPVGDAVLGQTALSIDISRFVPLIMVYDQTSDHKFGVTVTDRAGQSVTKTLTLHLTESAKAAPVITLVDGDIDAVQEIQETMSVQVSVVAQGKIAGFTVQIDSPALTPEILGAIGLSETLDLVNPGSMAEVLQGLGFPVGDQVLGQSSVTFDISSLVPMIALIYNEDSDHKFALTVTDTKEQVTTKTLTFHLTAKPTLAYNDDADLWANTATVTAEHLPDGAAVQYREKGAADWQEAELVEGDVYRLAPVWSASTNEAGLEIHTIAEGTGVFAASDYEVRVAKEGEALAAVEFKTAAGDEVPNGDMSGWSKKQMTTDNVTFYPITYPNAEGENFWDSGNNMFLEQYEESGEPKIYTPLCYEEEGAAVLMPRLVLGAIFAPGNMYTGQFVYEGFSGTACFGQPYEWTARPRALKVRCKATVGTIDKVGSFDPDGASYKDQQDRSYIFVAVVDWTAQHGVSSGMTAPTGMWNPAETSSVDEGAILGYGQQIISESTGDWVEYVIPVSWYDKEAANPSSSVCSLVISCATSMRGDYLTGSSQNEMRVDDFEWVY